MNVTRSSSSAPLLIADLYIHTVVLLDLVSTLLVIHMSLETCSRSVHSVCCGTLCGHTLLPCTVDLLAFNDSEIFASIDGSMRTEVAAGIDIEGIVKALSDFANPCLGDIGNKLPSGAFDKLILW